MKDSEIPWPGKGDKAFKDVPFSPTGASPHWLSDFSDMYGGDYQWAIVEGFKEAADKVVDSHAATKERMDVFFFPVVYLYRHAIELSLKGLVNDGIYLQILEDNQNIQKVLASHNLHSLWSKVRLVLKEMWPDGDDEDVDAVEKIILEFHQADKSGQRLRYSKDKQGKPHTDTLPYRVDLMELKRTMDGLFQFLGGCSAGLDDAKDWANDC
ncbi:MAG: hypothetical protein HQ580_11435 [Planctomycetes bacterium]|nr:hypothetical protein [Planctomycetota bacterium]